MTDTEPPIAHQAIRLAKQGKMPDKEMMDHVVAGELSVPMFELPVIENGEIAGWRPATASKADGSQWLIALTTEALAPAYCDGHPEHGFYMTVDTRWMLQNLPPDCGIVFNLRTDDFLEWNAVGPAKYKKDILRW